MPFVELIALHRCRTDGGTFIEYHGKELALFRLAPDDDIIVIDNACPHSSGNLSAGEIRDGVITCPLHHWNFDLLTGVCVDSQQAYVARYPAEVRDGVVWVDLPA